jgi:hypothetical protein
VSSTGFPLLSLNKVPLDVSILSSAVEALRDAATASGYPTIFIATTSEPDDVAAEILTVFKQEVEIKVCDTGYSTQYDPLLTTCSGAVRGREARYPHSGRRL